jgi:hypothetical protein
MPSESRVNSFDVILSSTRMAATEHKLTLAYVTLFGEIESKK